MNSDLAALTMSLALILGSAFFVAAEYSLISVRRSKVEAAAKKGDKGAQTVLRSLQNLSQSVAASQVAITMLGIGVGSVTEPYVTEKLKFLLGSLMPEPVRVVVSILLVTLALTIVGELVPKYVTLRMPDQVAGFVVRPFQLTVLLLKPLAWIVQQGAGALLRPFGIQPAKGEAAADAIPKEELLLLIRSGGSDGTLDKAHADLVTRALKLDVLDARDIMIHRLDVKWIDLSLDRDAVLDKLSEIPFNRVPVCRGDIDDMAGIVYVHDIIKNLRADDFQLEKLIRPIVAIPENLSMERIVQTMRDEKTQILVVLDEYGGTSGIVTLEDVVEEVFGELEDRLESERPFIETFPAGRVSARADVRLDEIVDRLQLPIDVGDDTQTLATMLVNALERMPRPGDKAETVLGTMRVENMARRRITRVSIQLLPELLPGD
ncbi:MAG: hemolysin family protein [Fimbriimonas sp.]